jgi:sporadic carbohydrate cluster protein (TIGR04323 family)
MIRLKGYIFSRPFFNERVPQHVQNIVNKNYCQKNNFNFQMSATEYAMEGSIYILHELIKNLKNYDGILFYSLLQLPIKEKDRNLIYKKILKKKKQIHFSVENISIKNQKDLKEVESLFKINQINSHSTNKKFKLGNQKNYVTFRHLKSKRNYLERMTDDKIKSMKISKKYDKNYWDGDRKYGYGGYKYIEGYYTYLAQKLIKDYRLTESSRILDVGCGKGFLMYELQRLLKSKNVFGCDFSRYAIKTSKKEVKNNIIYHDARKKFNFKDGYFDFVFSNTTLHNFKLPDLYNSLKELQRIGKKKYICIESYRNEKEQFGVQCWALTAETLIDTKAWKWLFKMSGYTGDFEFIYFG